MPNLSATLRLAKVALISLLECHASHVLKRQKVPFSIGTLDVKVEWRRRYVIVCGRSQEVDATLAFDHRASMPVGSDFNLRLERPDRSSGISFSSAGDTVHFAAPGRVQNVRAILSALPKVCGSIVQARSDIHTFLRTGDAATAARLRVAFGITNPADQGCFLPDDLLLPAPLNKRSDAEVTIIVPVYNAAENLAQLLKQLNTDSVPIIFVNDASEDMRVAPMLEHFSATHNRATVISKPQNEGFVAAVNLGLEKANGHVILLNTDTLPPKGWVERLLAPIDRDPTIASVTPISNNAEIISVPPPGDGAEVTPALVDKIDTAAQRFGARHQTVDLPTGIGFCMAMNRRFLDKVPSLDPSFGRGYGEEVDWCCKVKRLGGRHVALTSLFVGHKGGASFGAEKPLRLTQSGAIIRHRYPTFEQEVQSWVGRAPVQAQKLALSTAWLAAASDDPVPIFLGHSLGGGAETALQENIRLRLQAGIPGVIVLRVGGPSRWRLELVTNANSHCGDAMESATIEALLEPVKNRHVIYSCGVGARHPLDAPKMVQRLTSALTILDLHIHDFFPISPSWNLLDSDGVFRGVPDIACTDTAHGLPVLDHHACVSHKDWRSAWEGIFARANNVITYSETSRALVMEAYAPAEGKVFVQPHTLSKQPEILEPGGRAIGILGSLNRPKGAEVALRLATASESKRRIVVIGEMDGQFLLPRPHVVHGRFDHDQITALAKSYDIGLWLIPSICPETFSFATHEALATGLPVLAFNRGAQGEAVNAAVNGQVLHVDPSDTRAIAKSIEMAFSSQRSTDRAPHHTLATTPRAQPLH